MIEQCQNCGGLYASGQPEMIAGTLCECRLGALPCSPSLSDTPETDEYANNQNLPQAMGYVPIEHARKMERQRNQLVRIANDYIDNLDGSGDEAKAIDYRRWLDGILSENANSHLPRSSGSASCSASFDLDAPRLRELLEDYVRDKRQIGKDLGLPENERLHHRSQRRIIFDLQRENRMMRMALKKVYERMQGPASNRRLMQIAGPARECINLAKPFLPNRGNDQEP